jgi:G3E family GTPase
VVPVVILTGFLGSGKTTLLNRWLALGGGRAPAGGRLALIVNELGAVGIDGDLLPAGSTRQVELPGGCICCQLDEDLVATLTELTAAERDLELIVIETTGVADPLPIGWTLARPPLDQAVRLSCVVTLIDGLEHERSRPISPSVDAQVEGADLLAVSKLDLGDAADPARAALLAGLAARNPSAPVVVGTPGEVAASLWRTLADPAVDEPRAARSAPGASPHAHGRVDRLESLALPIEGTLDLEELTAALEELPASVIRIKGIARVIDRSTGSDAVRQVAFHRVGARVSSEPLDPPCRHRMVAIGRDLDRAALDACLRAAVVG